ncbi:exodeoxyribonuclease V gamma chain [Gordonia paraffinivorans NBRC 108238]|uniref:RecBCD enzyme subunit RecC n=1 Tax=Gordonia paraffinivorans NBRC 108238 TaxID=1223543 RepID=A0ABQ0IMZ6_9ACTN|nr:exodeoxyribonuclease V subunit gamma [Gordonia paraffinivorans]GAC84336.1 exodeoxyribonuclease V gamma chain [Gordonia paraffinivorans NBRC 108238]
MLILHRAERTDTLADALAEVLSTPLRDPMRTEIVSVPAAGVERWIAQHLACRLGAGRLGADGIAANIDFTGPGRLADAIADAVLHGRRLDTGTPVSAENPWRAAELTWPVLRVLDERVADPALTVIARHLGFGEEDSPNAGRRYATARFIAELFERYGRSRPSMIADWAAGRDLDGAGAALREDLAWQADFWRAVRAEIGRPHPAERLDEVCERLRADPEAADLPERLSVFGPTRITESFRRIIAAVAAHHDVHLFVPHPSPRLWADLRALDAAPAGPGVPPRRRDRPAPEPDNPLLAALSRDVQELQLRLDGIVDTDLHHEPVDPPRSDTLLGALQAGIRDGTAGRPPEPVADDGSVEVHACHGPERQVEVLRDRLLHLFDADPTLEPRDVLVMCPDVETFAPLIRGAFGQTGLPHPAFKLRVRLADRGLRHVNPIVDTIVEIVELAAGRVTAGDVLDLLSAPPVRARFGFTDDDLELVREWLANSNVRWGLGTAERARFGLERFRQGTFDAGLDRIALGVVAEETDDEWLGTALPLAGVESTGIDLVGRLDEFLDRLGRTLAALGAPAPAQHWSRTLVEAVDSLTATAPTEDWQRAQAIRMLEEAFGAAEETLRLADVRDLLSALVAGRPTRSNFRTGELTVCTMVPMRSVPHRVIVLLGIDAEVFPRVQRIDGDDILGVDPLVGERNPRDEDRQCFLDAIGAARDALLVFYSGADPVSGRPIPPAVVVSELVDTLTALTGDSSIVRRHTLHGFDARNFVDGGVPGIPGPFSHDASLLDGAKALRGPVEPIVPAARQELPEPATAPDDADIDLSTLVDFHVDPIAAFVRQRLGARIPDDETPHDDQLDVELEPLDKWGIGDRFLTRMLSGVSLADCEAAELRRGTLPPFAFGTRELQAISSAVTRLHGVVAPLRPGTPQTLDVLVTLPDGRRVHGTVGDVFTGDDGRARIVRATYSRLKAKQQLTLWITLLAVAAAGDQGNSSAQRVGAGVFVGRAPRRGGTATVTLRRPDDALSLLFDVVRLRDEGLRRPLPLPLDPALAFADNDGPGRRAQWALTSARRTFEDRFGPGTSPYVRFAFGGDVLAEVGFDEILAVTPPGGRSLAGVDLALSDGDSLFAGLARTIWALVGAHREAT